MLQGTSNVTLSHNVFESNGGNSLLLYGYNAGNTVTTSEFFLSGDSAIASVGVADFADGSKGDVPHDNLFEKLHIHNIGICASEPLDFDTYRRHQLDLVLLASIWT
eukprot:COSAG02_NODE_24164_length_696_cov_0.899497_2_plen_106_part_00